MKNATKSDLAKIFLTAIHNEEIGLSRLNVLHAATQSLNGIASDLLQIGTSRQDTLILSCALLSRLATELIDGIFTMFKQGNEYSAACLLRQLVEIEYLFFLGYSNPQNLNKWYNASPEELRKKFTPQKMRKEADGLFSDQEYWHHCEVGGHPHPNSIVMLREYAGGGVPAAFLHPDSAHHVRRLWTSLRLLLPKIDCAAVLDKHKDPLVEAIRDWETKEDPTILKIDGLNH